MTSRTQTPLVRGRSQTENLTFQLYRVNKCKTKKERWRTEQKKPRIPQYSYAQVTASQLPKTGESYHFAVVNKNNASSAVAI